jgi:hypothetical protein
MIKGNREDVMKRRNVRSSSALLAMFLAVVVLSGDRMAAAQQQSAIQRKVLLQQDLNFPNLQMVTTLVEIPVGVSEVRHTHPGVLGIYVLEGTLTLAHESRPISMPAKSIRASMRAVPQSSLSPPWWPRRASL